MMSSDRKLIVSREDTRGYFGEEEGSNPLADRVIVIRGKPMRYCEVEGRALHQAIIIAISVIVLLVFT